MFHGDVAVSPAADDRWRDGAARHAMLLLRHRCRVWSADHGRCCFERGHDGPHHGRSGRAFGPKRDLPALLWDGVKAHDSLEDMVDSWRVVRNERPADAD